MPRPRLLPHLSMLCIVLLASPFAVAGEGAAAYDHIDEATAYDHIEAGNRLAKKGEYARACDEYAKAVEIDLQLAEAYVNWGVSLAVTHKRSEAAELKPELRPQIEKIRKRYQIPSGK
ncbi:hypothetical protein HQ560_21380 [bacterium]|nr:hypothetical protein [bacterium]